MSGYRVELHDVAVGQVRDLVEPGDRQDARTRPGVDEDLVARERLAVDLDLMRAGEAAMPAIEGEIGIVFDLILDARAKRLDDLVLARDDLGHVHLDLAGVNAELRRTPGGLSDAGARHHRLGGCAPVIDAGATELAFLDESHPPALVRQIGGERNAALTGTDNDRIVSLQGFPPTALARRRGLGLRTAPDQMVERDGAGSPRDDEQQQCEPQNVLRPAVGIDEELDHQRHGHQRERR